MKPAFEIVNPRTGHRFAIYADGQIDGFGNDVFVINRIPALIEERFRQSPAVEQGELES